MDFQKIALAVHLLGFALGLGGATISDIMFFKALKRKQITSDTYYALSTLSKVIWIGLVLLIFSGLVIFWLIYAEQGSLPMLLSPRWQMKLLLVGVVLVNGFVFMGRIFPFLKSLVGTTLTLQTLSPKILSLAISGTVSILSWYSIFVVTMLPRTFRPLLIYFVLAYLVMLVIGIFISKKLMTKTLES